MFLRTKENLISNDTPMSFLSHLSLIAFLLFYSHCLGMLGVSLLHNLEVWGPFSHICTNQSSTSNVHLRIVEIISPLPAIGSITNSPTSSPDNFSDSDPKWCKQCAHITSCRNYLAWFVSLAHFSPAKRQRQPIPNLGANPFASFALLNCFFLPSSSACPDHNTVSRGS